MTVTARNNTFLLVLDGQTKILPTGVKVRVRKSQSQLRIMHLRPYSFADTLRRKLLWGAPLRQE